MNPDLISLLPLAVFTVNRSLRITTANPAAENLLEGSLSYLLKTHLADMFHAECGISELIQQAFASNRQIRLSDFVLMGPRIGKKKVFLYLLPLPGDEMLLCADDISAAHTLSHSAELSHQARFQGSMASILAHEVKNPLAGIKGAAQLLQKTVSKEDAALTGLICNEVDRIKGLVEEIEFFSNPSDLKTEELNIHEVLLYARSVTEKSYPGAVAFRQGFDPSLPPVRGNRNLLIQLLINLFKNSVEASDKNTLINVSTSYTIGSKVTTSASRKLPILISISDNGPGIPEPIRKQIFDPFVTTKKSGKGLGLAVAAKIMADHGGVIEAESPEGAGALFSLYLPVFN